MTTKRLTAAQALIEFLKNQWIQDGASQHRFVEGCFGIFGHGNLAGIGQALQENPDLRYYQSRNEQAMVHAAVAFARHHNRKRIFACTSSIGPGATNMVTGAALATINRIPVLLLPGDIFARRTFAPVLQQLESEHSQDISVNDCFKPVSRYWDRINRPEQLLTALPEAMRVLTSPSETGAVTIAMPQDVQTEAYDYPVEFFEKRVWTIDRPRADRKAIAKAAAWIKESRKPLIVAGGGTIYSEASQVLGTFSQNTGIPVCETQAGKGSLHFSHSMQVGAVGVTGTYAANVLAREADLVIAVGTRLADFTTASKTAFQNPNVRFININVCSLDAYKHNALPVLSDAREALEELSVLVDNYSTSNDYEAHVKGLQKEWGEELAAIFATGTGKRSKMETGPANGNITQGEVIGVVNAFIGTKDVIVCAAGSLPGDLHKLWNTRDPKGYHVEYGYSCMGYEIAGGMGVKMAEPEREVYVFVGDGSYLMMAQELVTCVQEGIKLNIILIDNHGFASIGCLSRGLGSEGFGTSYRQRGKDGQLSGEVLDTDFAKNAASLGVGTISVKTKADLEKALRTAKQESGTTVIVVTTDTSRKVSGYECWWDVPVAETSQMKSVQQARSTYEKQVSQETTYYKPAKEEEPVKV